MNIVFAMVILLFQQPTQQHSLAMASPLSSSSGIVIEQSSARPLSALPSQTVTLALKISAEKDGVYKVQTRMPQSWHTLKGPKLIRIQNQKPYFYLLGFKVPPAARAGEHHIELNIQHANQPDLRSSAQIAVAVSPVFNIELQTEPVPPYLVAGQPLEVNGTVYNRGNSRIAFSLAPDSRLDRIHITPSRYSLNPGEHQTFRLVAELPGNSKHTDRMALDIKAMVGDSVVTQTRLSSTVYPRIDGEGADYHTLPMEGGISTAWQELNGDRTTPYQVELQGDGPLFEGRSPRLSFQLRAPGYYNQNTLLLPSWDRYRLSYTDTHFTIDAGDQAFRTSRLSGYNFSGFGGGMGYRNSGWESYFYYARNRFSSYNNERAGGRLYRKWNDHWMSGLNVGWNNGYQNGTLATLEQVVRPLSGLVVRGEAGAADTPAGTDLAAYSNVSLDRAIVDLDLDFLTTGTYYPTTDRGVTSLGGSMNFKASDSFSITTSYRESRRNYYAYGMRRLGISWKNRIKARWNRQVRRNDLSINASHNILDALELTAGYRRSIWNISSTLEVGKVRYKTSGQSLPYREISVQSGLRFWRDLTLSSAVRYTNGGMLYSYRRQSNLSFQLGLNGNIAPNTSLQLSAMTYRYEQALLESTTHQLRLLLSHQLGNGHTIDIRGELRDYARFYDATAVMFTYRVPFNLKLGRSGDTGRLQGRLLDRQTGSGIPGVPVLLGHAGTVTDENGRFNLPGRKPGEHELSVIQTALGMNHLMEGTMPMKVHIIPGQDTYVNLYAQRSGSLEGVVMTRDAEGNTSGLGNALVQLQNREGDILRRLTKADGSFGFKYLKPGTYRAELIESYLPKKYRTARQPEQVLIHYGSTTNLNLMLEPAPRNMKMLTNAKQPETSNARRDADLQFTSYTVQPDDWLSKIAIRFFDDAMKWPVIWNYNRNIVHNPDRIYPGTVLRVPLDADAAEKEITITRQTEQ